MPHSTHPHPSLLGHVPVVHVLVLMASIHLGQASLEDRHNDDGLRSETAAAAPPAVAGCPGAAAKKFVAPAWSDYNTPATSGHGIQPVPAITCHVCDANHNIAPLAMGTVKDDLDFNLTEQVLNAINVTSKHPVGYRSLLARWEGQIKSAPEDNILPANQTACVEHGKPMRFAGPYWNVGAGRAKERAEAFLELYRQLGGELDELVMDTEIGLSQWEISCNGWTWQTKACTNLLWDSIANYKGTGGSHGFAPIEKALAMYNVTKNASDPHWLGTSMSQCLGHATHVWDSVMDNYTAGVYNKATWAPLQRTFPEARLNQYGYYSHDPSLCVLDPGGWEDCDFATHKESVVGTHQTLAIYNDWPGNGAKVIQENGYKNFVPNAFNTFKYDGNRVRMLAGAQGIPFKMWLAYKNFSLYTRDSDYYQETVLHAVMLGSDDLLFFNPFCPFCGGAGAMTPLRDNELFSQILAELTSVVGCQERVPIVAPPAQARPVAESRLANTTFGGDWDDEYFLSGMHLPSAKLTVWRFTPNTTDAHPSPTSYITATAPILTLDVPAADKTADPVKLSFPGGRVYSPETAVSSAGLWIVVPDRGPEYVGPM